MSDEETLKKLQDAAEKEGGFTTEEIQLVREIIKAYRGWRALGWASKFLLTTLAAVAGGVMAWRTVAEELKKWFVG